MTYARIPMTTRRTTAPMAGADPLHVVFCSLPAYGHVYPLLPLAMACRDAGHDVTFVTSDEFVLRVLRLGFPVHSAGISVGAAERIARDANPQWVEREDLVRLAGAMFADVLVRHTSPELVPFLAHTAPDLVVYEETDFAAAVAARVAGIPAIGHALGRQVPEAVRVQWMEALLRVCEEIWPATEWSDLFIANPYLDIAPPSLRDPAATEPAKRIFLRPVSRAEPGDGLPGWITQPRSRPLAYVTLGTVVYEAVESLRRVIAGLGELDLDVLVTVGPNGDPSKLGPVHDSVRVERFVPQDVLLPHVDVVLHHCGSGTMLGSLAHGLPQLALPHGADQFFNAEALQQSGAGLRLLPEEITPELVAAQTRALLIEPGYRNAARRIAGEIAAMPAPTEVVRVLERIAARAAHRNAAT